MVSDFGALAKHLDRAVSELFDSFAGGPLHLVAIVVHTANNGNATAGSAASDKKAERGCRSASSSR